MTDDLVKLREAFDTLGIDPAKVPAERYLSGTPLAVSMNALADAAARLTEGERPIVTRHTPPGTEIEADGWHGPNPSLQWTDGVYVLVRGQGSKWVQLHKADGWREVRRPAPVPVEVGQWRAMPVLVHRMFRPYDSRPVATVRLPDDDDLALSMEQVESWPVIPPPDTPGEASRAGSPQPVNASEGVRP